MAESANFLDASQIVASTFVRHVELHDELPSTNDRAIELSKSPQLDTPVLVAARMQTAGRGRGTNKWVADAGALTFSLILDTNRWGLAQCDWPRLSLATAVAVRDAVAPEVQADSLQVKWPNDVMLLDRKLAGILIESPNSKVRAGGRIVIGVGINVNNASDRTDSDGASARIAICDVVGKPVECEQVLIRFLLALDRRLHELGANDTSLLATWKEHCWLTGRRVAVVDNTRTINGKCNGIDNDGALILVTESGKLRIHSGSIRLLET